jgi:hypothetical protein
MARPAEPSWWPRHSGTRRVSQAEAAEAGAIPGDELPGSEGSTADALYAARTTKGLLPGDIWVREAERVFVARDGFQFVPSRALSDEMADDWEGLIQLVAQTASAWLAARGGA